MNTLILDGGPRDGRGASGRAIASAVAGEARARGHAVTAFGLDERTIKPCQGCFACWIKHPGSCAIKDDQAPVLEAMARADLQVWITPLTFGGYSPALKKSLDRCLPNILPFIEMRQGEVHHPPRYERRRRLLVLGTSAGPDPEAEALFHRVVGRNALNLDSVQTLSIVVGESETDGYRGRVTDFFRAAEEDR
jgi:multimeric flavodoxin WrbA